jgi:hypothetical protein
MSNVGIFGLRLQLPEYNDRTSPKEGISVRYGHACSVAVLKWALQCELQKTDPLLYNAQLD